MRRFVMVAVLFMGFVVPAHADDLQAVLDTTVKTAREAHHLPALAMLVQIDGKVAAQSAIGVRAEGQPEAVTTEDLWHIGSDTKAMTATMIARLVERGVMKFEDTLAVCFPDDAAAMNEGYRNVTVAQLLSHMAGLPALTDPRELLPYYKAIRGHRDVKAQRAAVARAYLSMPPSLAPGSKFQYSNLGFIIAGAAAERRTGKSWEELVRAEVFEPLGITHVGFGAPGSSGAIDQPRGHMQKGDKLVAIDPKAEAADNPPSLGPAGTVHISLHDWALFAQDQLDGALGRGQLLKPETYKRLQTPIAIGAPYAMGWGVKLGPDGVPLLLTHTGSNGAWLADIRVAPKHNIVILTVMNVANDEGKAAIEEVRRPLVERLHPFD